MATRPNRYIKYSTISIRDDSRLALSERAGRLNLGIGRMLECMLAMSDEEIMKYYEKSEGIVTKMKVEGKLDMYKKRLETLK